MSDRLQHRLQPRSSSFPKHMAKNKKPPKARCVSKKDKHLCLRTSDSEQVPLGRGAQLECNLKQPTLFFWCFFSRQNKDGNMKRTYPYLLLCQLQPTVLSLCIFLMAFSALRPSPHDAPQTGSVLIHDLGPCAQPMIPKRTCPFLSRPWMCYLLYFCIMKVQHKRAQCHSLTTTEYRATERTNPNSELLSHVLARTESFCLGKLRPEECCSGRRQ